MDALEQRHLARLIDGYLTTQLLYVAAKLGVADVLADGPRTPAEIAEGWARMPMHWRGSCAGSCSRTCSPMRGRGASR